MAKLSDGFAGSTTRSLDDVTHEVETRMKRRRMDAFTEDFAPPGPVESTPGEDRDKPGQSEGYGKPHEDSRPVADPSFTLDSADKLEGAIKKRLAASDNAAYDVHQADPARLSAGMIHHEEYKGRHIHVMESGHAYGMTIDSVMQPGKFPGVATAVQRGRILIDRAAD